jgi:hypothetical protein
MCRAIGLIPVAFCESIREAVGSSGIQCRGGGVGDWGQAHKGTLTVPTR